MSKRVLFVCAGNLDRSPTAEQLYSKTPGLEVRSAGTSDLARTVITEDEVDWAVVIFVMERKMIRLLRRRLGDALKEKELICLSIPDDYQFMQAELLESLTAKLTPYLGPPVTVNHG